MITNRTKSEVASGRHTENTGISQFRTFHSSADEEKKINAGVHFKSEAYLAVCERIDRLKDRGLRELSKRKELGAGMGMGMGSLSRSKQQIPSSDLSKCKQNK